MIDNERGHEPMMPRRRTGAVLLVVVFLVAFSALLIGGLLHALASDLQIVKNDLTSTQALYVADAGIEDAIAALRADSTWAAGFAQKAFRAGSSSYYTVAVANTRPTVVITSTGVVSGYQRTVEVQIAISETSPPYPVIVVYWKELPG